MKTSLSLMVTRHENKEAASEGQRTYIRNCYSCGKKTIVIKSFGRKGDFIFFCNRACFTRYINLLKWEEKTAEGKTPAPFWNALVYRIKQLEADINMLHLASPIYVEYKIRLDELSTLHGMEVSGDWSSGV